MADALLVHDWLPLSDYAPFSPSADLTKRPITGPVIRFNFQPKKNQKQFSSISAATFFKN